MLCLPTLHQMPTRWEDLQQPQDQHGRFWRVTITSAGTLLDHQKDGHWNFGHNTSLCEQHTQLSEWAGGKGKDISSAIFYFWVFDFFLRKEVQNKWNRKGDSEPMAGKNCKKTRVFCKDRSVPCQSSTSAPEEYIDNRSCQERMAQEDPMTSWKAAQSCGVLQPAFSYIHKTARSQLCSVFL